MKKENTKFPASIVKSWKYFVLLALAWTIASCSSPDDDMTPGADDDSNNGQHQMNDDETNDTAPDFSLVSLSGTTVKLSDYDNKVVVLFFFGNSCPSCKAVAPDIESKLNKEYSSKTDYVILGLDQWNGNKAAVQSFKDNTGISFPLLLNASAVAGDYDTTYDRLVLIDKSGKVVHKGTRAATNDLGTVKTKVDALLDNM